MKTPTTEQRNRVTNDAEAKAIYGKDARDFSKGDGSDANIGKYVSKDEKLIELGLNGNFKENGVSKTSPFPLLDL